MKATHKLDLKRPRLRLFTDDEKILEVNERLLVIGVLRVDSKGWVVH